MSVEQIHATCVGVDGRGVLLRGPSGSGKSDLALRLIDQGGMLVADDRVNMTRAKDSIIASPPPEIIGLFEVRGLGILRLAALNEIVVGLLVDLADRADIPRLPEITTVPLLGQEIRYLRINAHDASAPAKIRLALGVAHDAMVEPEWPKK